MEVVISEVTAAEDGVRVAFESACGRGQASWDGAAPRVGQRCVVELEHAPTVAVGEELLETNGPVGVREDQGIVTLTGHAAEVGEDGYVRIDLGCGTIALDTRGGRVVLGRRYALRTEQLRLYDTHL